jgi:hypothetical protein
MVIVLAIAIAFALLIGLAWLSDRRGGTHTPYIGHAEGGFHRDSSGYSGAADFGGGDSGGGC